MAKSEQVIKDLDRVIGLINTDMKDIPAEEKKQMVADTIDHFDNYVSPGWLKYRKSVSSDSEQGAVLEWQDEGAYCYGLNGEKFIDCLGGFGIYTCGHRNPEILKTVKAQLDHQALHSQELLDPLRGYLAKALADITPGDLQYETAKGLFARRVMTAGTLVNAKTIRFEPTAVISEQDIKDVISRMDEALADTKKELNV